MNRTHLHADGPEISRLVYGAWRLLEDPEGAGAARVREKIDACLRAHITTFDHADIYGGYRCEEAFGAALKEAPALREKMELITKCGVKPVHPARPEHRIKHYDTSRSHIIGSVEESLSLLNTDYVDVLLIHQPGPLMDPDEIAEAFHLLKRDGKVLHLGVSNFNVTQYDMLVSRVPLVTNQLEIHPLRLDPFTDGSIDRCLEHRTKPMAWSPTAGGAIFTGDESRARRVRETLEDLARKYGHTTDQMLYAWLLRHPAEIIPVLGTNQIDRIRSATGALDILFDIQDWFAVWCASTGEEVRGG